MKDSRPDTVSLSACAMVDDMKSTKAKRIDQQLAKERAKWLKRQKRNKSHEGK